MAKKIEAQIVELKKGITGSVHVKGGTIDVTGSVGINELPPITGTVSVTGSVGIKEMAGVSGTVHISGGTVDATVTVSNIGTVRHLISGTVGIDVMPSISGSVWIKGTVETTAEVTVGSIGIKDLPPITGSIDIRTGSIQAHGSVGVSNIATNYLKEGGYLGSVGHILSGTVGVTGSVGIKEMAGVSGSVGIKELPSITGSIDIRTGEISIASGTVEISSLPSITGSIDIRGGEISIASGTVEISSLPSITGSIDIRELPSITGSVDIRGGTIDITGSVGIKEMAGVSGSVGIKELPSITGSVDIRGGTINVKYAGVSYAPIRKNENLDKSVTGTPIWTPAAGKAINLTDEILSAKDAMPVSFALEGTLGPYYFAANGGLTTNLKTQVVGSPDGKLSVTTTGTATVTFIGFEE